MQLTLPVDDAPDEGFVPVRFHSKINELGIFELWCNRVVASSPGNWSLMCEKMLQARMQELHKRER